MTTEEKIRRLETAIERLCVVIDRVETRAMGFGGMAQSARTELELIKQYIRGDI